MQSHEINVKVHFGNISIGWKPADSCHKTFYTFKYNSTKKLNTDALLNAITESVLRNTYCSEIAQYEKHCQKKEGAAYALCTCIYISLNSKKYLR